MRKQLVTLYQSEETQLARKCTDLSIIFNTAPLKFNELFTCTLYPNMQPGRSLDIFKIFLTKSQLPYEMVFALGKCMQMCTLELAEYYNKEPKEIDADMIVPYLILVTVIGIHQTN